MDYDSPAFQDFVRQAREFLQVDADRSWLQEVWLGADADVNRAINHIMDTPPEKVRKSGQGVFSQPSSPSKDTKKKKSSKSKNYHGSDVEGYGDEKAVRKAKRAAKRAAAQQQQQQQQQQAFSQGFPAPPPNFANGAPPVNPMAGAQNGPAGMFGVINNPPAGNYSNGVTGPRPSTSPSPGREGPQPSAMTAMQQAVGGAIQALQSQLIVLMQHTINATPTSNVVAAQQHNLLSSMQTQVNSISNSLTASTKLPYPQQQNSLDTINKQIQAVQLQMLLLQQQHQLQSDLFELDDESDDDEWWCQSPKQQQQPAQPATNGHSNGLSSAVIGGPPPTWAGPTQGNLPRTPSFGAQPMQTAPQLGAQRPPFAPQQHAPPASNGFVQNGYPGAPAQYMQPQVPPPAYTMPGSNAHFPGAYSAVPPGWPTGPAVPQFGTAPPPPAGNGYNMSPPPNPFQPGRPLM